MLFGNFKTDELNSLEIPYPTWRDFLFVNEVILLIKLLNDEMAIAKTFTLPLPHSENHFVHSCLLIRAQASY